MTATPRWNRGRLLVLTALAGILVFLPAALRFIVPALSPFMFLSTLLATRVIGWSSLCAIPVLALVIWRRRGFCRFCCPVGWVLDACAKARPSATCSYARVPRIGQWAALLTLGGALASCPLFLFLDPLGLFVGAAGAVQPPFVASRLAYAGGFVALIALSFIFPSLWCRRLCPLGGTQDWIADAARAVTKRIGHVPSVGSSGQVARRTFVGISAGAAVSVLTFRLPRPGTAPLRPPGAVDENVLKTLCLRCGNCVRSCPAGILQPDLRPGEVTGFLAPIVRFDAGHCRDDCNQCGAHCPSGAIAALPLDEKNECKIGLARIERTACLLTVEKECGACKLICKRQAIVETFSEETYSVTVHVDEERCNGCGACVAVCPPRAIAIRS